MAPDVKERVEMTIVSNMLPSVGWWCQCLPLSHCTNALFGTEAHKRRKQCLAKIFLCSDVA